MKIRIIAIIAVIMIAVSGFASAEEKFGVKVYDGAKHDAATSQFLKEAMSLEASCYRTNDAVSKVVDFYKKQPGLKLIGESNEGAMFRKAGIDITIQTPWMDMKTGMMMKDTLISIVMNQSDD
jgi:hypothetical protein